MISPIAPSRPIRLRSSCAAPGVVPSAAAMSAETWPLMKPVIDAGVLPMVAASPGLPLPLRSSSSTLETVVPALDAMPAKLMFSPPLPPQPAANHCTFATITQSPGTAGKMMVNKAPLGRTLREPSACDTQASPVDGPVTLGRRMDGGQELLPGLLRRVRLPGRNGDQRQAEGPAHLAQDFVPRAGPLAGVRPVVERDGAHDGEVIGRVAQARLERSDARDAHPAEDAMLGTREAVSA